MKQKIILIISCLLLGLSFYMGFSDVSQLSSCGSSCASVHNSSFGNLFGIPLAFYGSLAIFLFILFFHFLKFKKIAEVLLIGLVGGEIYFTILQFTFLDSLCVFCLIFASGLFLLFLLNNFKLEKTLGVIAVAGLTHFIFFPPLNINENDNLFSLIKEKEMPEITIYASPSCAHCETAVDFFKEFCCTDERVKVFVKPVSLSGKDKEKAIKNLCQNLFNSEGNPLEQRIAENFILKNEKELKEKIGQIQTPYIEINFGKDQKTFIGWNQTEFLNSLLAILDNEKINTKHKTNAFSNTEQYNLFQQKNILLKNTSGACSAQTYEAEECSL
jgi:uncharacterized membrane protein/glutaredoxin